MKYDFTSFRRGLLPERAHDDFSVPYTRSMIAALVKTTVLDGLLRTIRFAPLAAILCAFLYDHPLWGVADAFGGVGLVYSIYFWFQMGHMEPIGQVRDPHTLALCPEIDEDDMWYVRAGSALTASCLCFLVYVLLNRMLTFYSVGT